MNGATHIWTYRDATGAILGEVHRFDRNGAKQVIPHFKRNGNGFQAGGLTRPRSLYGLDTLANAEPDRAVFWVEGEKCAAALHSLGLVAVTSQGGSKAARQADFSPLEGRSRVYILPDNDKPGHGYAEDVAAALRGLARPPEVFRVKLPDLPKGGDVVDYLQRLVSEWDGYAPIPDEHRERVKKALQDAIKANAEPMPEPQPPAGDAVLLACASELEPKPIDWLWPDHIAAGKFQLIGGAPGTGKTTLAMALAAPITQGGRWPDGTYAEGGDVVIWSGEDDPADTLVPRLLAAGADRRHAHFVRGTTEEGEARPFDPACDAELLRQAMAGKKVRLLIVDPIVSAVAGDSHKNGEVRRALQPLADLAAITGCAVLGITHFSKGTQGRDPLERVTGSIAFGALARVVFAAAKSTEPDVGEFDRLFVRSKSNIGPDGGGWRYSLEVVDVPGYPGIQTTKVRWGEILEGHARELLGAAEDDIASDQRTATDEATEWLEAKLADGPVMAAEAQKEARAVGINPKPLRTARERLGVKSQKTAMGGGWEWYLPAKMPSESEDAQISRTRQVGTFEGGGHLREPETDQTPMLQTLIEACQGLQITPERLRESLAPEDLEDIQAGRMDTTTVRAFATALGGSTQ